MTILQLIRAHILALVLNVLALAIASIASGAVVSEEPAPMSTNE